MIRKEQDDPTATETDDVQGYGYGVTYGLVSIATMAQPVWPTPTPMPPTGGYGGDDPGSGFGGDSGGSGHAGLPEGDGDPFQQL
jgi:hypothetical protein